MPCRINCRAIVLAGILAGILATLVQMLLWIVFDYDFPAILWRDARLTAALMLGRSVLPPPFTFDAGVMLVATFIHFALSIAYAALLAAIPARLEPCAMIAAGAGFGVALYFVNLYGFASIFPWFGQARGPVALIAHGVFGAAVMLVYRRIAPAMPD